MHDYPKQITIAIMGDGGVGKSSIVIRSAHDVFVEDYDPTISDWYCKTIRLDEELVRITFTDDDSQEEFLFLQDEQIRTVSLK